MIKYKIRKAIILEGRLSVIVGACLIVGAAVAMALWHFNIESSEKRQNITLIRFAN